MPEAASSAGPLAARLAALHKACFTTPRPWSTGEIADLLDQPQIFLILPRAPFGPASDPGDGFLIGSALAGEAELLTLAVAPGARRQGLGRRLVTDFLTEARARGADLAFLEVSAENSPAILLYEAAGFALAGRRKGYYLTPEGKRIDALVLSRDLSDAHTFPPDLPDQREAP